ncbi:nucleotide exchange factor GrpE [Saccharopolyspora erythraea]
MAMRGWFRLSGSSPVSGTGAASAASEPEGGPATAPDSDSELGADMTAVDTDALASPLDQALAERATLIQLCMYAMDRARSSGVVERLSEGLGGIGVVALRPDGMRFDPAHHEAGGTMPTDDPALDGMIAETEVLGFADRDRVLRAPIVTVYRLHDTPPR